MIVVVQRVLNSSVEVDGIISANISNGLLVFLGIKKGDTLLQADFLVNKLVNLRIFSDNDGKMNLSVQNVQGDILVISQFTLCTDNQKSGNHPSFTLAEEPEKANAIYEYFISRLKSEYMEDKIYSGIFSAHMKISILNDGPVTIILEK